MGSCAGISSESLYVFLFFLFSHWFLIFVPSHLLVSFVFLLFSHGLLRFRGLHCLLLILFLCTCGCVSAISSCRNELPPESKRGGERERTTEDKTGTKQPQTPQKHKNIRSPKRRWCSYTYREGNPSVRLEVPLSYTASVYKSYREGKLSVRLQASFFLYSFYTQFI